MFALKDLLAKCGSVNLAPQGGAAFDFGAGRASYIFNPTIAGIEQADALLIIGSNPRKEAAVLNARIRKRWRSGQLKIGLIGAKADLTYAYDYLGAGTDSLGDLAAGKHSFADVLKARKIRLCWSAPVWPHGMTVPRFWRLRQSLRWISARSRTAGTALAFCTIRPRASARSISASHRMQAG